MTANQLPQGYRSRPGTINDLDTVVGMFNIWSQQVMGVEKFTVAETKREWSTPGFDPEKDTLVVIAPDGEFAGVQELWDEEPHVRLYSWMRVHPKHVGTGIGAYLLQWAEERARQAISKATAEARIVLVGSALSQDETTQKLYSQAGFNLVRHMLRMVIEMNGTPPPTKWPNGINVRQHVYGQDEEEVVRTIIDAFKDHWGFVEGPFEEELERWKHYIDGNEDYDPSLWFLAMDVGEIAGVSLCWPKVDDDHDMGWVGTLGVRRPWRRRGLGLALLQHSFQEFYRRGKRKVGLGVDAQNLTGATRLYRKAGMQVDSTRQFTVFEKELRAGKDLSTQSME